ncbi:hypothetical protein V6Z72_04220 [Cereibacter sphaeroides]|uniref:hypothetical protein n=1 Tax=Cereibacter sphaeroides TaxID=1063 RepID=UPI0039904335
MEPIDHPVSRYALDVVEGRETAGELVRLACLRHLTDVGTGRDRGLWFDCHAASRVLTFAELIQHTTGALAGRPLTLPKGRIDPAVTAIMALGRAEAAEGRRRAREMGRRERRLRSRFVDGGPQDERNAPDF